jgi:hypothetical protein
VQATATLSSYKTASLASSTGTQLSWLQTRYEIVPFADSHAAACCMPVDTCCAGTAALAIHGMMLISLMVCAAGDVAAAAAHMGH